MPGLAAAIAGKAEQWKDIVKIGRTHMQDATPITLGQEWSGYARNARRQYRADRGAEGLYRLALGGTAVGTGINAAPGFPDILAELTALRHRAQQVPRGSLDAMVGAMARCAACRRADEVANDMRWLASGPRCGLASCCAGNEPGSSIMPGKVNPTQRRPCHGLHPGDRRGQRRRLRRQPGQFRAQRDAPIIINNFLHSARILGDACDKLRLFSVEGAQLNRKRIDEMVDRSLMLVTALPVIGTTKLGDRPQGHDEDLTLEAALASRYRREAF